MASLAISVNETLAFTDGTPDPDALSGFQNGLLWSQAVARKTSTDPSDLAYFEAMTSELARVAWNVTESTTAKIQIKGERVSAASIVASALSGYVDAATRTRFDGLLKLAQGRQSGAADAASFLSTWWSRATVTTTSTGMVVGSLSADRSAVSDMVWLSLAGRADDWQTLFVERSTASLKLEARYLKVAFNPDVWAAIGPDVIERLGDQARAFIHTISL